MLINGRIGHGLDNSYASMRIGVISDPHPGAG